MRVIGGEFRGRGLDFPKDRRFRPTQDRVREAVFSAIQHDVEDARVLDLCCGTGSFGIEALSRGARECVFVDTDVRFVRKNLKLLDLNSKVVKQDACRFVETCSDVFDLVFFDPPYAEERLYRDVLNGLVDRSLIASDGVIVVEYAKGDELPEVTWGSFRDYTYGSTAIRLFR